MSLRRAYEGTACPRFGDGTADATVEPVTGTRLHRAPVTTPVTNVTNVTADVVTRLDRENAELRLQVARLTAQLAALAVKPIGAIAPAGDSKAKNRAKVAAWRAAQRAKAE